ncbi:MAG TPA: peptidylprolyl isomerase [Steroidobacteraceae bacterium]|jgi:peptidyl-prolyl cis-trans isomerase C|nr:peptidylprolyl isomerase [Steroidobacteraceae bacterium]
MKVTRLLALGVVLALAACSKTATDKPAAAAAAAPAKPPLVTVNGKPISDQLFEDYVQAVARKPSSELPQADRDQIKENLVRITLIAEQAEKDGLTKDPEVATRLELSRLNLLQQASAQKYLKERTPTEEELRAEFDAQVAATPLIEYHARHILVSSEDVAKKVIDQLKGGADFANLAKRLSADKGSAVKGGDLDWFAPNAMVKPFGDALALLKNGEVTKTPVQTEYGFHVIQLLGTRDRTPPAFEDVKERLSQIVLSKKFKTYSDEMLKNAKIDPPLAGVPAAAAAPAPAAAPAATPEKK